MAAQRQSERAHLASLAESLSDGIVLVDAELRVTSLNSAAPSHLSAPIGAPLTTGTTITTTPLAEIAREAEAAQKAQKAKEALEAVGAMIELK